MWTQSVSNGGCLLLPQIQSLESIILAVHGSLLRCTAGPHGPVLNVSPTNVCPHRLSKLVHVAPAACVSCLGPGRPSHRFQQ